MLPITQKKWLITFILHSDIEMNMEEKNEALYRREKLF